MGIATNTDDEAVIRSDFERLKRCFEELKPTSGRAFDTLSMGMSSRFSSGRCLRLDDGARGSLIFGERDYSK